MSAMKTLHWKRGLFYKCGVLLICSCMLYSGYIFYKQVWNAALVLHEPDVFNKPEVINSALVKPEVFKPEMLDVLNPLDVRVAPPFSNKFRNPCWYENAVEEEIDQEHKDKYLEAHGYERTSTKLRCLPYFFILGMPRCATTDLFLRLAAHPQIISPAGSQTDDSRRVTRNRTVSEDIWNGAFLKYKSPRYWSRIGKSPNWNVSHYVEFFNKAAADIASGGNSDGVHDTVTFDASIETFCENNKFIGDRRVKDYSGNKLPGLLNQHYINHLLPQAKLIVVLRDPTERLFSAYVADRKKAERARVAKDKLNRDRVELLDEAPIDRIKREVERNHRASDETQRHLARGERRDAVAEKADNSKSVDTPRSLGFLPQEIILQKNNVSLDFKYSKYADDFDLYVTQTIKSWQKCIVEKGFKSCLYSSDANHRALAQGIYVHFLSDWLDVFPGEQMAIIHFEEYVENPNVKIKSIVRFLGLRDLPLQWDDMVHSLSIAKQGPMAEVMLSSTKEQLDLFYRPFQVKLKSGFGG